MQLPLVAPAPLVTTHAQVFRDLFENRCQFQHFQNDLTGLMALDNKSLAHMTRWVLESADKTHLSRCFSAAPGFQDRVHDRRLASLLQPTPAGRGPPTDAALLLDDPLCEHVGSRCDSVERHDHHGEGPSPRAHHPLPRHDGSGPVRFPVARRLSRRDEACTRWAACVHQHCPDRASPTKHKARPRCPKAVAPVLLAAPDFQPLHPQLRTQSALGVARREAAIRHHGPLRGLWFASWSLAAALVSRAHSDKKAWVSWRKKPRNLETNSFVLQEAAGQPLPLEGPPMAVAERGPRLPPTAYRAVPVRDNTSWTFPLAGRLPGLGPVRLVVRCHNAALTGTSVVLVTHRVAWGAQQIITLSRQRWPLETFSQDGKTQLGLDEDRRRNAEAMKKHGCLVCVASSFWHLDCLPSSPTTGSWPIKTIGEACRQPAQALMQAFIL